ncbi:DNA topoisomerase I [archaeon]|nr:DNA topoisomerase I [archaeon]
MKLIVAEKPLAAKRIASFLGKSKPVNQHGIECYQLPDAIVVPLKGHVTNVDFAEGMQNWSTTKLDDLSRAPIEYKLVNQPIAKAIQFYAKGCDQLIIATDYDREGESIGKEAITIIGALKKMPVKRARFSSLTAEDVESAFSQPTNFDYNLADSADARREIDLIWGAVLTRFISLSSGSLGKQFLSVGRVQTPTLALCVDREKEIRSFKPQRFWVACIFCDKSGEKFTAFNSAGNIFDKNEADRIAKLKGKSATVDEAEESLVSTPPPSPFSTNEFLRSASTLGVQPAAALSIAESLYMRGYISYPRTDNTVYPKTLDLRKTLKKLSEVQEFEQPAKKLLMQKKLKPTAGKREATDHPPIHPVEAAPRSALSQQEWKVYELVCRRFLATLAPDARLSTARVELKFAGERFIANGKTVLDAGWREYYPYSKVKEELLPKLAKGDVVLVDKLEVKEDETKPKPRYSPAALLKLMESLRLGTKSTRADTLQKLLDRGYITGKNSFTPSQVSFAVIDSLEKTAKDITTPGMTANLEEEMDEIERGKKVKDLVVEDSRNMLLKVLSELESGKQHIGESIRAAKRADLLVGKCSQCGSDLIIIATRKGTRFVGCTGYSRGCRNSFPLPAKGKITVLNRNCADCGTMVIQVKRPKTRAFEMCINHKCKSKEAWGKGDKSTEAKP